ncbi:MAG: 8-oxo-dGTP diphosphatase [Patescibacteria group bacterium]|mgnify:CR=1 FL=1
MFDVTLCFLTRPNEVLLAIKKRGFGAGKWNGIGGKVIPDETIPAAACREIQEEIGVIVRKEDLESRGTIEFFFPHKPEWNQRLHIFFVKSWELEPQESEEMRPLWYAHDQIPYNEMWVDDFHWLPRVLAGKSIRATFRFKHGFDNELEQMDIKEI